MKLNKLLLLMLFLTGILSSFAGGEKASGKSTDWIPADFDPRQGVLLVKNFSIKDNPNNNLKKVQDKVSNDMKKEMQASYPYKFEMADFSQIKEGSQYADKDKYRWILVVTNSEKESKWAGERSTAHNAFHIYDRKTDKHYPDASYFSANVIEAMRPTIGAIVGFLKEHK